MVARPGPRERFAGPLTLALFALLPAVVLTAYLAGHWSAMAVDFRSSYWVAGWRVLHGSDPYAWSTAQIQAGVGFVYPPGAALVCVPFALLPLGVSTVAFVALCVAATFATLGVLGVREWRLYGLAVLWPATIYCWQSGNLTSLLVLGAAVAWRYRDRPGVCGPIVGVLVAVKLFLWPLGLWLLLMRRWRAPLWAAVAFTATQGAGVALLGPSSIHRYSALMSRYWPVNGGASYALSSPAMVGCGLTLTAVAWWLSRRRREGDVFAVVIILALVASPVVWNHYFALLMVPLVIMRPRPSLAWCAPLALFGCAPHPRGAGELALAWGATAAVAALAIRRRPDGAAANDRRASPLPLWTWFRASGSAAAGEPLAQRLH